MTFPSDLKYTKDHEWLRVEGTTGTIGITDYAQGELGDVIYLDLKSDATVNARIDQRLADFGKRRDMIAGAMSAALNGAAFGGHPIDERTARSLIDQGQDLLHQVREFANSTH